MPETIERFDWAVTPLGPKADWPAALRTSYDVIMGTGFAACATWGPEQTLIYNAAYIPILGARHPQALGQPIREVWQEIWNDIEPLIDRALGGERVYLEDLHLVMTRNGYPEDTYWTFSYSPLRDGEKIEGMLDIAVDTTARVAAERANAIIIGEATHRMKNTLAVVQAIAKQSLREVSDREAVKDFERRLQALASAHDILHFDDWESADLEALVDATLAKLADRSRYALGGAPMKLSARVAQALTLAIHELGTNAIKYGAWSSPAGRVSVTWDVSGSDANITWREDGGPPVVPPRKQGFGSKLIASGLLGAGGVETRFEPDGLEVRFTAPLADLLDR